MAESSAERSTSAPIRHYRLVGDTRTAALCSADGSLDWLCLPRFDGAPVFGRLVGGDAAGCFRLSPPPGSAVTRRRYRPGSAVLETTWRTPPGELSLTEGMVADGPVHPVTPSTAADRRPSLPRSRSRRLRAAITGGMRSLTERLAPPTLPGKTSRP